MELNESFITAIDWLRGERQTHQPAKFNPMHEDGMEARDDQRTRAEPEKWDEAIGMYLHRARTLGLNNPLGRQAVAKATATAVGYLESIFRVYGDVPVFGSPSGEVKGTMKTGGAHHDVEENDGTS